MARRVAAERGEALGGSVGYAVRFDAVGWPSHSAWTRVSRVQATWEVDF